MPVRHDAGNDITQALRSREHLWWEVAVSGVVQRVFLTCGVHRRRRCVEPASPEVGLFGTVTLCGLHFVEAL